MPTSEPAKPRDPAAQVLDWLLSGASQRDILAAVAAHYPGADAPALIAAATKDVEKAAASPESVLLGWCIEATRSLYRRTLEIGDYVTALRAVKQLSDLARTNTPNGQGHRKKDTTGEKESEGELRLADIG